MELLQFRYFLTAAKYQHMTHAAESLGIAQPALSQSIKRLEDELKVPLFERKSRTISLTPEGKLLEKRLIRIMSAVDSIKDELNEYKSERDHVIHLSLQAATTLITNCIIDYKALHPDISFQLSQITKESMMSDIYISTSLPDEELLSNQKSILKERIFLAVPRSSKYAGLEHINLQNVAHEDFISLSESKPVRSICDHFCMMAGFVPHIIFESDSLESVRNLIAAGLGVGFWPEYSWGELDEKQIKLIDIENEDCIRDIIVTTTDKGREKPAVNDFYKFMVDHIEKLG